jgi:hypothetical protein
MPEMLPQLKQKLTFGRSMFDVPAHERCLDHAANGAVPGGADRVLALKRAIPLAVGAGSPGRVWVKGSAPWMTLGR